MEHNIETGEVVEREMTTAEAAQYAKDAEKEAAKKAQFEAKAAQKAEILERLGITSEEAKLLLS